jgi:hypothetical protein
MGLFSMLNPMGFGRKNTCAWNTLMAAYTFPQLRADKQRRVRDKVLEIHSAVNRQDLEFKELAELMGPIGISYFMSLAMMNLRIAPALGNKGWFRVKNPFMDTLGVEEFLPITRKQLEQEHGVSFPDLE